MPHLLASSHAFICGVPAARARRSVHASICSRREHDNDHQGSRRVTDLPGLPLERKVHPIPLLASR
eukprot:11121311-Lingulodinium_polyedra.AAC.1